MQRLVGTEPILGIGIPIYFGRNELIVADFGFLVLDDVLGGMLAIEAVETGGVSEPVEAVGLEGEILGVVVGGDIQCEYALRLSKAGVEGKKDSNKNCHQLFFELNNHHTQ